MSLKPSPQRRVSHKKPAADHSPLATGGGGGGKRKKEYFRSKEYWYHLCELYVNQYDGKISQSAFLKSPISGEDIKGTTSDQMSFGRNLQRYKAGTLQPVARFRERNPEFTFVEKKIVEYLNLFLEDYRDEETCGLSWIHLQQKALEFAKVVPPDEAAVYAKFSASPGWIANVLRRNGFKRIKLNNQGAEGNGSNIGANITAPPTAQPQHVAAVAAAASLPTARQTRLDEYDYATMHNGDADDDDDYGITGTPPPVQQHEDGAINSVEQAEAYIDKLTEYGKDMKMDQEAMGHLYIFAHLLRKQAVRHAATATPPSNQRVNHRTNQYFGSF